MNDHLDSQKASLTGAQPSKSLSDGVAAMESISSANGIAPPMGILDKMYLDITDSTQPLGDENRSFTLSSVRKVRQLTSKLVDVFSRRLPLMEEVHLLKLLDILRIRYPIFASHAIRGISLSLGTTIALLVVPAAVAAAGSNRMPECAVGDTSFDGISPLKYAIVSMGPGAKVGLYEKYPGRCSSGSCKPIASAADGEVVAVGKTCEGWSYVQHIDDKAIDYGWIASDRLKEWMSPQGDMESTRRGEPVENLCRGARCGMFHYRFRLITGNGVPVCNAYLQRLNRTEFKRPPYCGRPESNNVPGFEVLHRVYVSAEEMKLISGQDTQWPHGSGVWRYQPRIDADNDGRPDDVIMWDDDDREDPDCGMQYIGVDPTLQEGGPYALVMSADGKQVDSNRTQEIFGDKNSPDIEALTIGYVQGKKFLSNFHPYGESYGLFRYRGLTYFDAVLNRRTPMGSDMDAFLGVYLRKAGKTQMICKMQVSTK